VDIAFVLAMIAALAFAFTNGFHDAANAIATLVATRVARPLPAVAMAAVFNLIGPLFFGAAVANTIAKIVAVPSAAMVAVVGAGLTGAVIWNTFTWWKGLPSSSSHALIGGLVGAALLDSGIDSVNWGGLNGIHPSGVFGTLAALAVATLASVLIAMACERLFLRAGSYLTRRMERPVRLAQWGTSAWLAFSHGSNDAMKTVGIIAALLLATGRTTSLVIPTWAILASAIALTAGTALGGWNIVRTIGKRIFPLRQLDGLVSQTVSAAIIMAASGIGAPVSTTQVVAASVVGIGGGRRRWSHVNWTIVRDIATAWLTTMPAAGIIAALTLPLWRLLP
jgi:PiT family inorganic phosphate transporter